MRLDSLESGQRRLETEQRETNVRLDRLETGQRETNARLDQTNAHLGQVVEGLGRVADTVEALSGRMDRYTEAVLRRLTERDDRTGGLEERVARLEAHVFSGT